MFDVKGKDNERGTRMQFQILIYNNAEFVAALEDGLMEELDRTHATVIAELEATGELVSSEELSPEVALTVRTDPADGKRVRVTDGPFSESKEWVGGFYTVDVGSIDRAVEIAGRFVEARYSPIEVRLVGRQDTTRTETETTTKSVADASGRTGHSA